MDIGATYYSFTACHIDTLVKPLLLQYMLESLLKEKIIPFVSI